MTDFTKFFLWMGKHFLTFVTFAFWDKNLEFLWSLERKYPNLLLTLLIIIVSPLLLMHSMAYQHYSIWLHHAFTTIF